MDQPREQERNLDKRVSPLTALLPVQREINRQRGHPDGATLWIYDRGTHALEVASTERAWFTRQWQTTGMVGGAKAKAQARIEIHGRHGLSARLDAILRSLGTIDQLTK